MNEWLEAHRKAVFAVTTVVVVVVDIVLAVVAPDLTKAQRATSFAGLDVDKVRLGAGLDYVFMVAYAAWFWAAFSLVRDPRNSQRRHPAATAGVALAIGGALADAVENVFLLRALGARDPAGALTAMRAAGLVKWALLGAAALTLVTLVVLRSWRRHPMPGLSTDQPDRPADAPDPWLPPAAKGEDKRIGVCLSGGGIRSAAFCLGGLQALREKGHLAKASYLASASGGGYLAAGWAVSDAAGTGPTAWGPGSPEERWFRDHASYLIPDLKGGAAGLFRLLAGVVVNLLVIGLALFAVARPVGWAINAIHPELRATDPTVLVRDSTAEVAIGFIGRQGAVDNAGAQPPIARFWLDLKVAGEACFDEPPYKPGQRDICVHVRQDGKHRGVVEVQGGHAKVVAQPRVVIAGGPCAPACKVTRAAFVASQPAITVVDDLVVDGQRPSAVQFKVAHPPKVSVKTGLGAVTYPKYRWWMWELTGGLLVAGLLVALAVMSLRLRGRQAEMAKALARALAGAGALAFLVIVAFPWLVVWIPRTLTSLTSSSTTKSSSGSGLQDYLLPSGGVLAAVLLAARQWLGGAWLGKARGALAKHSTQLKWYALSPTKVLLAVLGPIAVLVAFVNVLQFAVGNGIHGRLMGFAFVRDYLPGWMFFPDWAKFAVALAALVLFAWAADAQSWSLYPFYKARLSSAFLLRRLDPHHAEPIPYTTLLPFSAMKKPPEGPQLVACCAVNLNDYGVVPPGRRAASFTFSSTEIGGPLVGYATPADYEALSLGRRRDVTVASAMAISGAAFSPAMGKFNLGPVGGVLALANLRLGVWIPHPQRVRSHPPEWWSRPFRRPHWVWFLRELTNRYRFDRRYVYVSDGGHWDNLGLVELLRRGCTEIYCISGAGDGAVSFGTIGEAIALAREELGVEMGTLDPSPLRSATKAATPAPQRELRRNGAKDAPAVFAAASYVSTTFTYTRLPGQPTGTIYYVEADLTADMPFDVHTFAESATVFPDDSTGDQVFDHRQFESYRALGYHQTKAVP
ncbi:MAG: hypothetical protein QOF60_1443 [Actinomycetota bacterium]|jgi:hypothetical protein|nr:hypothetical protein [Actinomycetota bacterium]